jgi:hypothetical protein
VEMLRKLSKIRMREKCIWAKTSLCDTIWNNLCIRKHFLLPDNAYFKRSDTFANYGINSINGYQVWRRLL